MAVYRLLEDQSISQSDGRNMQDEQGLIILVDLDVSYKSKVEVPPTHPW